MKVSEEEIMAIKEAAFFYPSDLVNTKTTTPVRVGKERWIYTSTLRVLVYIHRYSPPLRGIVVYYLNDNNKNNYLNATKSTLLKDKYLTFFKSLQHPRVTLFFM